MVPPRHLNGEIPLHLVVRLSIAAIEARRHPATANCLLQPPLRRIPKANRVMKLEQNLSMNSLIDKLTRSCFCSCPCVCCFCCWRCFPAVAAFPAFPACAAFVAFCCVCRLSYISCVCCFVMLLLLLLMLMLLLPFLLLPRLRGPSDAAART